MAPVMFDSSKTWRKLSSVNPATSMSALQNVGQRDDHQRSDRQDRGDEAVGDDRGDGQFRRLGIGAKGTPAVRDEAGLITEQHLLGDHHEHAEQQQRRPDRRGGTEVDRRLRREEVHVGRQHGDPGVAAEQQRAGELTEPEQQGHAAAVDEHGAQQRQRDPEEHAEAAGPADLRSLEHLGADVGEPRAHEQVHESGQPEAGDDDDPRHRVDVDRALLEVVPPWEVSQQGVEIAGPRRQQERPADDRRHGRHDDGQHRQDPQQLHARWQPRSGPRQERAEDEGDGERAEGQSDSCLDRVGHAVAVVGGLVTRRAVLEGQLLQAVDRDEHEVADGDQEGEHAETGERSAHPARGADAQRGALGVESEGHGVRLRPPPEHRHAPGRHVPRCARRRRRSTRLSLGRSRR